MQRRNFARERSSRGTAVTGGALGILAALTLLRPVDGRTFWIGFGGFLAAAAAYALLGPALSTALRQISLWLSPRP